MATPLNITTPSKAYAQVKLSIVYRVSELTFGSLLAAYILGFVAAIATHWPELSKHGHWGIVLLITQYASISLTFAYATTSLYLTYHAGILTMPQMSLDRLGIDFSLAVLQALFFGFSLLRPWSFLALLGISLFLAAYRQRTEHRALAEKLREKICGTDVRNDPVGSKEFRVALTKLLRKDFPQLSAWGPTGLLIWFTAVSLIVIGAATVYLVAEFLPTTWRFRNTGLRTDPFNGEILVTLEVMTVMIVTILYGHRVLKQRATFLQPPRKPKPGSEGDPEVDIKFCELRKKLEELCEE